MIEKPSPSSQSVRASGRQSVMASGRQHDDKSKMAAMLNIYMVDMMVDMMAAREAEHQGRWPSRQITLAVEAKNEELGDLSRV